jgi:phosphatidylglycerophosphate synthase
MQPRSRRQAPSLREIKERTLKPVDAWWTVLAIDPLAVRLVWLCVRLPVRVSPGFVTAISLVFGLSAGYFFWIQAYVWGALFYEISFLLDCVDGKLSRLEGSSSPLGAFWDGVAGELTYLVCVIGLGAGLENGVMEPVGALTLLLGLRALNHLISLYSTAEVEGVHSAIVAKPGSWLARKRLLPPFAFPDRHLVLFVVAPITGFALVGMLFAAAFDVIVIGLKVRKIIRAQ